MYHVRKKAVGGIIFSLLLLISLNSCKMKQLYYTQEGTPYILRTTTRTIDLTSALGQAINPSLVINANPSVDVNNSYDKVYVTTDKSIVPVMMNYTVQEIAVSPVVPPIINLSTPYYHAVLGGVASPAYLPALSKCLPNIEAVLVNDNNPLQNRFGIKYNQIVLTDKDFITSNINNIFQFKTALYECYPTGISSITSLLSGRYIIMQTVIYFELQK